MSGKLPGMLGYSWEGSTGPTHGIIDFEDASGMLVQLPAMLCRDFETFHDVLEIMFRKRPGYMRVTARDYEIEGQEG
ncbi:hypothetical protein K440DRAFT_617853 [Wilcoxina mikolae CBS 423.85]|nr:hypothetical protein K440DRAFT_617853 [Wilcoxina mikolae CBS 423.85]